MAKVVFDNSWLTMGHDETSKLAFVKIQEKTEEQFTETAKIIVHANEVKLVVTTTTQTTVTTSGSLAIVPEYGSEFNFCSISLLLVIIFLI